MPKYMYVGLWNFTDDENSNWNEIGVTDAHPTKDGTIEALVSQTEETITEMANLQDPDNAGNYVDSFFGRVRKALNEFDDVPAHYSEAGSGYKNCYFAVRRIRYVSDGTV